MVFSISNFFSDQEKIGEGEKRGRIYFPALFTSQPFGEQELRGYQVLTLV